MKKKPRVTAAELVKLTNHIEEIWSRASNHYQATIWPNLLELQGPLVVAIGKLTLDEERIAKKAGATPAAAKKKRR